MQERRDVKPGAEHSAWLRLIQAHPLEALEEAVEEGRTAAGHSLRIPVHIRSENRTQALRRTSGRVK